MARLSITKYTAAFAQGITGQLETVGHSYHHICKSSVHITHLVTFALSLPHMLIPQWWYNIEIPSLHPPTAYAVPNQKLLTATSFMATLYTLHETKHLDRPVTLTNLCPLTSMNLPL